jgi:hypothetical protein
MCERHQAKRKGLKRGGGGTVYESTRDSGVRRERRGASIIF